MFQKSKTIQKNAILSLCIILFSTSLTANAEYENTVELGRALYFDPNLSLNRTQSCATCHDPSSGFSDSRQHTNEPIKRLSGVVSLGDDGKSFGDRSAPTVSYANQSPEFHRNKGGKYIGGQFWDGRASNLVEQAKGPPLNPIEMGAPSKAFIKDRILENKRYTSSFIKLYGKDVFENDNDLYDAVAQSIASFEKTDFFSPFDSKYDRYLKGEYQLTKQEELGMILFFSQQFTNCNQCHQLRTSQTAPDETFTDYSYHNIGVPVNTSVRSYNQAKADYIDEGLLNNPAVSDSAQKGKFKVPTLRNVAVTGPYMHNGVFKELRTVVSFYNKYNSRSAKRQINPETGENWAKPEVSENISIIELETGPALDDKRIDALVAFMKILTDKRYEHLLD